MSVTPSSPFAIETLVQRLGAEFSDPVLALEVVERLDQRALDALSSMTSAELLDVLSYSAPVESAPEALVVFAFGNRAANTGALLPGPVNLVMASLADEWAVSTGLPVVAQWEVADEMRTAPQRVGVVELEDGSIEYLSTAGVADQVRGLLDVRRVVVMAMTDHAVRCCRTLERVGFVAGVPAEVSMPTNYDGESGQPWTRERATYLAIDILARCLA